MSLAVIYTVLGNGIGNLALSLVNLELNGVHADGILVKVTLDAVVVGTRLNIFAILADGEGLFAYGHLIGLRLASVNTVLKALDVE